MEIKQMKKGKSIRIFLIAIVALAIVAVTAICVFGTDGTVTRGDMNGDGRVDSDDAVYLLRHTFLPSRYPVGQSADVNGDGKVNSDDAVYLLRYTFLPERYPLACDHKEVTDAAKPATCTETGLTEGKHCSVCGKVLVEQKVIPITHDCDEQKFSIVIKNDGSSAVKRMPCQKCSAYSEVPYCGYYVSGTSAYKFGEDGRRENLTNVFIEFKGDTYYVVNNVIVKNYYIIDGKVYNFGNDGKKRDTVINNVIISIEGNKYYVVNNVVVINSYVFDDGHIYRFGSGGVMLVGTEFGGYMFGNDGRLTSNDKTIYIEIDGIFYEVFGKTAKKHAHNYSEKIIPATCTSKGYTEHSCSCGSTYKDNEKPMTEHNYVDDVCTGCGKQNRTSEGLIFSLNSDRKSYTLFGIGTCKDTEIVIPSEYDGFPVIAIGDDAFYGCKGLTSITIPDSVTSIDNYAFYGCDNLQYSDYNGGKYLGNDKNPYMALIKGTATSGIHPETKIIADSAFSGCTDLTSITIPDSVTHIGDSAFSGCKGLTSITIPDSVTSIGYSVFSWCDNLKTISLPFLDGEHIIAIPSSVKNVIITKAETIGLFSFQGFTGSLTSITIPDSVTSISRGFKNWSNLQYNDYHGGKYLGNDKNPYVALIEGTATSGIHPDTKIIAGSAFSGCKDLTSITIPDSVTYIGEYAFNGCSKLTSITIPDSVTRIGYGAFSGCSALGRITVSRDNAVYHSHENCLIETASKTLIAGCKNSVIPTDGSVTSIGGYAFYGCTGLTSIMIPDSVTSIGASAFSRCSAWTSLYYCTGLTSVTIGNSVTSIGGCAFYGCEALTSVTIGNSVTSIGASAFSGCKGLISITIPDSVTHIGAGAFSRCFKLTSIVIPDSVTYIGDEAFYQCTGLASVTIGNGVTYIGKHAFYKCTGLTSVTIGNSVTSIGDYAFYGCEGLTSITIPDSVTSIGEKTFYNCSKLETIIFKGTEEQWNAIAKRTSWDGNTGNYTMVFEK